MDTMPGPDDAAAINPCAYLLTWSWRLVVTGRSHCPLLGTLLDDACGHDAGRVFRALCSFLCTLALAPRRRLEVNPPGCPQLTHDEKSLLAMVAAAQHDWPVLLDAHLCRIAHGRRRRELAQSVHALAAALDAAGLWLPAPDAPRPAQAIDRAGQRHADARAEPAARHRLHRVLPQG